METYKNEAIKSLLNAKIERKCTICFMVVEKKKKRVSGGRIFENDRPEQGLRSCLQK